MNTNLHAHVSTTAADCDGPIDRSYVTTMRKDEIADSFGDIQFMNRVLSNHCSPYSVHQLRLTMDDNGFEWSESTEEGYRAGEVRWCRDDCDTDVRTQRDHFAEAAGY